MMADVDTDGLRAELDRLGVERSWYTLKGHGPVDGYALKREGKSWIVFYAERGNRSEIERFSTEDLACRELLRRLTLALGLDGAGSAEVSLQALLPIAADLTPGRAGPDGLAPTVFMDGSMDKDQL